MEPKKENFLKEVFRFSLIAILIVVPIRIFIAQPFVVSGASMQPNFDSSEYLIVDQLSYRLSKPRRADVVIFKYPKDTSIFFIKRVIGLPNETVKMDSGELTIKNTDFPEGFGVEEPYIKESIEDTFIVTLKDDEYFVLGDNRKHSSDSRIWGPLEDKFIVGKPFVRLFPINEFSVYPGDYSK